MIYSSEIMNNCIYLQEFIKLANPANKTRFIINHGHYLLMRILFICNQNLNRSKTAEDIFKDRFETKSAGLYNDNPVSEEQLSWADIVIVMEDIQRKELSERFPKLYLKKQILSLNIPDTFFYGQPELITVLKSKVSELF